MKEDNSYQQDQKELHKTLAFYYGERYRYRFSRIFHDFWNSEILSLSPPSEDGLIVDFGCGTGILFPSLAKRYSSIVGLDLSYDMIKNAPRGINEVKGCIVADGGRLPFHDNSVNLVICRGSMHHLPDLDKTLIEIKRILNNNGLLIFSEPSNDNLLIRFGRFLMYKLSSRFDERDTAFITSELVLKLTKAGLSVEAIKRFGFFSYLFGVAPDHFPLMIYIPFNVQIIKLFIFIDKLLARVPLIKDQSFHVIFKARKFGEVK
ncbi:MAG: class I SAM-dependent methyltransferase [Nitrospiraceae bacterium]|nr:MAG: class I SAM-dependent methyltransferase [Nitrospiraceae bacterium]